MEQLQRQCQHDCWPKNPLTTQNFLLKSPKNALNLVSSSIDDHAFLLINNENFLTTYVYAITWHFGFAEIGKECDNGIDKNDLMTGG